MSVLVANEDDIQDINVKDIEEDVHVNNINNIEEEDSIFVKNKKRVRTKTKNKQVECQVCLRKMRSDTLKRHMRKHREIHTLDEDKIHDEIKCPKQTLETMKYHEHLELSKELKSRSDDDDDDDDDERHKQVECIDCLRKMQSDNIKCHMLKHRELYLLDVDEIRDEISHRKKLQETRENRLQLMQYITKEEEEDDDEEVVEEVPPLEYSNIKTPPTMLNPFSIENDTRDADQIYTEFQFESFITGYFHYQFIWTPQVGEVLTTTCDSDNTYDKFAINILKNNDTIVGHTPRQISKQFTALLKSEGTANVKVIASPINTRTRGLRVPCTYMVSGKRIFVQYIKDNIHKIN